MEGARALIFLVVFLFSINSSYIAYSESGGDVTVRASERQPAEVQRYSTEQFEALSDAEKRDVYLKEPYKLPEGFSPEQHWDILHPEVKDGGN